MSIIKKIFFLSTFFKLSANDLEIEKDKINNTKNNNFLIMDMDLDRFFALH